MREDVYFNTIYILQSLTISETRTGDEIERVIRYLSFNHSSISAKLINIDSKEELLSNLKEIKANTKKGILPFIHFEVHGSKDGLDLNNDKVNWLELKQPLLEINKECKNNLFISLATCYGAYILKLLKPWEPCPFYGYIAPIDKVGVRDAEASYTSFFTTLIKEKEFASAISSLLLADSGNNELYNYLNCEGYFYKLVDLHKKDKSYHRLKNEKIKELVKKFHSKNSSYRGTKKELIKQLDRAYLIEEDKMFTEWKSTFLHEQIKPINL